MNNLTTRRLVLGLLMTFLLAFGVPGVVDAVNEPNLKQSSSDFFRFRTPNTTFSISVPTLSFDDDTTPETVKIIVHSDITLTDTFLGQPGTIITLTESDSDGMQANDGSYFTTTPNADGNRFGRSFRIEGRFKNMTFGEKTVKISSNGWTNGNTADEADAYTFHYYVTNATSTVAVPLTNNTDDLIFFDGSSGSGYAEGDFGDADIQIFVGETTNDLSVEYSPRSRLLMSHDDFENGKKLSLPSGPISSQFDVFLRENTSTDVVTAQVQDSDTSITGVYIYGFPTLEVDAPTKRDKGSDENPAKPGEVVANAFTATVKDDNGRAVPGVPVTFMIRVGAGDGTGELGFGSGNTGMFVDADNGLIRDDNNRVVTAGTGTTLYVRTNSSGKASVNWRPITGNSTVTVTAVEETADPSVTAYTTSASGKTLTPLNSRPVPGNINAYDLYVLVEVNGERPTSGSNRW